MISTAVYSNSTNCSRAASSGRSAKQRLEAATNTRRLLSGSERLTQSRDRWSCQPGTATNGRGFMIALAYLLPPRSGNTGLGVSLNGLV